MICRPNKNSWKAPPDRGSLETHRRIHTVCQQFEADWRETHLAATESAGKQAEISVGVSPPQLKTYLVGVAEPQRSLLLRELLTLELELRSTLCGEQPTEADYKDAFPEDAKLIAEVFQQWRDESDHQPTTWNALRPTSVPLWGLRAQVSSEYSEASSAGPKWCQVSPSADQAARSRPPVK